ncbi:MAG: DUF2934 domain-containing protein [Chthoniobacterales bacterium]|nr:DUF2934 domain-containing protein [Chthoniobacterales bacterium]
MKITFESLGVTSMAKAKKLSKSKSGASSRRALPAKAARPAKKTEVRNTATPRKKAAKPAVYAAKPVDVTHEMIAQHAYDIHQSGRGGSQDDNWHRALRELRGI